MNINKTVASDRSKAVRIRKRKFNSDNIQLLALNLPSIIWVLLFCYIPMVGLVIAFKNYKIGLGIWGSPWNGLDNFKFLFESNTTGILVRNTILYNIVGIVLSNLVTIVFAILLYNIKSKTTIKIVQSCMFLPYFLSWIVISYISYALLEYNNGIFNHLLALLGKEPVAYYSSPKFWPPYLISFAIWKGAGFSSLVYYGSLMSLDSELMEAAAIDGCGYIKRIWHIMLPHLKSTVVMLLILNMGSILKSDYGMFYYLPQNQGQLYDTVDVLDTYIMRSVRVTGNYAGSSAAGFIQSIVGCLLVITVNKITQKLDEESSIF